jgi:hypothetical protein
MFTALIVATALLQDARVVSSATAPSKDRRVEMLHDPESGNSVRIIAIKSGQTIRESELTLDMPDSTCLNILQITWPRENTIAATCHFNATESLYIELDPTTLKTRRAMMIFAGEAVPSPDGSKVAAFGPVPHSATEDQQSKYIVVDNADIYPLPPGKSAEPLAPLVVYPKVESGDIAQPKAGAAVPTFVGMHDIPAFAWSPDSTRIALVDTTYDLTPGADHPREIGPAGTNTRANEKSALVVVTMDGTFQSFPLRVSQGQTPGIRWKDATHVEVTINGTPTTYAVK